MDALAAFAATVNPTIFHPPPMHRSKPSAMKPVDPPSGPKGVAIFHDDALEAVLEMSSPIYRSIPLQERGFKDSYFWKSLPLTSKLGVPLCFKVLAGGSLLPLSNTSLELLSLDCDPESEYFGEPLHIMEEVVLVARQDGRDLLPKQMRAIIAFLDTQLLPLVLCGIHKHDADEIGGDSISAEGGSEQIAEQVTLQEGGLQGTEQQESSSDSVSDDRLDSSSTAAQPDDVTKQKAEAALSQVTPETFASFFDSYRSKQAKEDATWKLVKCPTETTSTCEKCGIEHGLHGEALQICGGCRRVLYCSRECQKADWAEHKTACKRMVWKMSKRLSRDDAYE
ncbi:hypothetical protein AC578_10049 [Pseudocercospora eumusae]|uniref:MYND-type domain-containing protein n=1 Tax=Pseudocercospora eumusae TaxID=321146 RepID=A0A139H8H8_9PEZI|nr:hypothetical protein AC578_10049 [Pseudocercospora eumusae]